MPSLRTLDVVHRLNSPTRAAAARRRRLRKAVAIACLLLAAVIVVPGGAGAGHSGAAQHGGKGTSADGAGSSPALRGRHALTVRPLTPVGTEVSRVDVWDGTGARLARCAPTLAGGQDATSRLTQPAPSTSDAIVTVALTDAEVAAVTRHLAQAENQPPRLVVTACL